MCTTNTFQSEQCRKFDEVDHKFWCDLTSAELDDVSMLFKIDAHDIWHRFHQHIYDNEEVSSEFTQK